MSKLNHTNQRREITLTLEPDGPVVPIVGRLKSRIKRMKLPDGYFVEFTGRYKSLMETAKGFGFAAVFSVIIIALIMIFQFNSFIPPLAILFEIPLAFSGAFLLLEVTRVPIGLSAGIGFLTLLGIAVNNGIILLDYTGKLRLKGAPLHDALKESCSVRLRPIILTTLTTIFGLLPIALAVKTGSQIHRPLAVTIIGGLMLNAFFTLTFLPAVYSLLEDITKKKDSKASD